MQMTPEQRERCRSTILPISSCDASSTEDGAASTEQVGGSFRMPRQRSNSFSVGASCFSGRRVSVPVLPIVTFLSGASDTATGEDRALSPADSDSVPDSLQPRASGGPTGAGTGASPGSLNRPSPRQVTQPFLPVSGFAAA
jgi:hypothetical protein